MTAPVISGYRRLTNERITAMKKLLVFTVIIAAVVAFAAPIYAGGAGAIKAEFTPNVGWVILNPPASGKLIGTAHLNDGLPNEEFTVSVRVRYMDGTVDEFKDIATLTTNGQGKGNVHVQVDINPPAGSDKIRRVAFRVRRPGPPNILYNAIVWDIPLKSPRGKSMRKY